MKGRNIAGMLALVLLPLLAWGQQKDSIEVITTSEVEVREQNAKGVMEVKRIDAAKAKVGPGDVVIFSTRYVNRGKEAATNVSVTNPVPEHMQYVDMSAGGKGTRIEYSIDGGKTYAPSEKLKITDKQGKARPALPKDFTHIRWTATKPLAPGEAGNVSFRARIQ